MIPVFYVKNTESYEVADGSYEICRLGQHLGSKFTERTDTGGPNYRIGPDCVGRAKLE